MHEKFPALTGVRALAAYLVFLHHYTPAAALISQPVASLLTEGHIGVTVFYVLSGFLITYNYADHADPRSRRFWIPYLMRRAARIYPLYLFLLLLTFLFARPPGSPLTAFLNVTLSKGFFAEFYFSGIPQAWSLTVEETFYFMAPLLFGLMARYGAVPVQVLLYATGGALMLIGAAIPFHGFFSGSQFVILYTFFGRSFEFIAGMWLARRQPERLAKGWWAYAGLAGCLITLAGLAALRGAPYKFGLFHPAGMVLNNLVLPLWVCLMFAGLIAGPTRLSRALSSRPAVFLGKASYAFYLVHLGVIGDFAIARLPNNVWLPFTLFLAMNAAAALLYLAVEHPVHSWVRSALARGTMPSSPPPRPLRARASSPSSPSR